MLINETLLVSIEEFSIQSDESVSSSTAPPTQSPDHTIGWDHVFRLIIPYSLISLTALVGNSLVIVTLAINRNRSRSVTNVFLINLAVSDLLLACFCVPFTVVGVVLRRFIFGAFMCRLIPYVQAVSVSVNAWTLVAMSVERYYAICHPLQSKQYRQSLGHARRIIAGVWFVSCLLMSPIAYLSRLQRISETEHQLKCREDWPSLAAERCFMLFLDVYLLLVPLIIMTLTYWQIGRTLWQKIVTQQEGEQQQQQQTQKSNRQLKQASSSCYSPSPPPPTNHQHNDTEGTTKKSSVRRPIAVRTSVTLAAGASTTVVAEPEVKQTHPVAQQQVSQVSQATQDGVLLRLSGADRALAQKRRAIKMLFVLVAEFFICWTPLYVINTLSLWETTRKFVYATFGLKGVSLIILCAFLSSCTNPIIYCLMNETYRRSFVATLLHCNCHSGPPEVPHHAPGATRAGSRAGSRGHGGGAARRYSQSMEAATVAMTDCNVRQESHKRVIQTQSRDF